MSFNDENLSPREYNMKIISQQKSRYKQKKENTTKSLEQLLQENEILKQALEKAKEVTKDPITKEEDPVFKYVDKFAKYLPLVQQFISGFQQNKQSYQAQQLPQVQIQPPPRGYNYWQGMTKLQRLAYKYDARFFNYEECVNYENYLNNLQMQNQMMYNVPRNDYNVVPNNNQAPVNYNVQQNQEPKSMRELQAKYPEAQNVGEGNESDRLIAEMEKNKDNNQKVENKEGVNVQEVNQEPNKEQILNGIQEKLTEDNQRWLDMIINFLKNLEMDKFKEHINNLDALVGKAKGYFWLIPFSVKTMFKSIPTEQWLSEFKTQCPEKYAYLEETKQVEKVTQLFDKLKGEL